MRIITAGLILGMLFACGSGKNTEEQEFMAGIDTTQMSGPSISEDVINDILGRIPAPLEISLLLKESGKQYNSAYLNSTNNVSRYNTNYKKALNLGIYGTDLGYTNIYEQNNDGIKYLASIKELADGLNIGQFFEIETIGRLATNSKNLDSLLLITTQNFNDINHYLQGQSRASVSVLLLTGGWLEALHLICKVAEASPENQDLQETIGEQKIILENIVALLSYYKDSDENMASLLKEMQTLNQSFEKVNITYTYKSTSFEIVNGVMVIKDNSTSNVEITPEIVQQIASITQGIRSKITS